MFLGKDPLFKKPRRKIYDCNVCSSIEHQAPGNRGAIVDESDFFGVCSGAAPDFI